MIKSKNPEIVARKCVLLTYKNKRYIRSNFSGLEKDKSGEFLFFVSNKEDDKNLYLFIHKPSGIKDDYTKEKYLFDDALPLVTWKYTSPDMTNKSIVNPIYSDEICAIWPIHLLRVIKVDLSNKIQGQMQYKDYFHFNIINTLDIGYTMLKKDIIDTTIINRIITECEEGNATIEDSLLQYAKEQGPIKLVKYVQEHLGESFWLERELSMRANAGKAEYQQRNLPYFENGLILSNVINMDLKFDDSRYLILPTNDLHNEIPPVIIPTGPINNNLPSINYETNKKNENVVDNTKFLIDKVPMASKIVKNASEQQIEPFNISSSNAPNINNSQSINYETNKKNENNDNNETTEIKNKDPHNIMCNTLIPKNITQEENPDPAPNMNTNSLSMNNNLNIDIVIPVDNKEEENKNNVHESSVNKKADSLSKKKKADSLSKKKNIQNTDRDIQEYKKEDENKNNVPEPSANMKVDSQSMKNNIQNQDMDIVDDKTEMGNTNIDHEKKDRKEKEETNNDPDSSKNKTTVSLSKKDIQKDMKESVNKKEDPVSFTKKIDDSLRPQSMKNNIQNQDMDIDDDKTEIGNTNIDPVKKHKKEKEETHNDPDSSENKTTVSLSKKDIQKDMKESVNKKEEPDSCEKKIDDSLSMNNNIQNQDYDIQDDKKDGVNLHIAHDTAQNRTIDTISIQDLNANNVDDIQDGIKEEYNNNLHEPLENMFYDSIHNNNQNTENDNGNKITNIDNNIKNKIDEHLNVCSDTSMIKTPYPPVTVMNNQPPKTNMIIKKGKNKDKTKKACNECIESHHECLTEMSNQIKGLENVMSNSSIFKDLYKNLFEAIIENINETIVNSQKIDMESIGKLLDTKLKESLEKIPESTIISNPQDNNRALMYNDLYNNILTVTTKHIDESIVQSQKNSMETIGQLIDTNLKESLAKMPEQSIISNPQDDNGAIMYKDLYNNLLTVTTNHINESIVLSQKNSMETIGQLIDTNLKESLAKMPEKTIISNLPDNDEYFKTKFNNIYNHDNRLPLDALPLSIITENSLKDSSTIKTYFSDLKSSGEVSLMGELSGMLEKYKTFSNTIETTRQDTRKNVSDAIQLSMYSIAKTEEMYLAKKRYPPPFVKRDKEIKHIPFVTNVLLLFDFIDNVKEMVFANHKNKRANDLIKFYYEMNQKDKILPILNERSYKGYEVVFESFFKSLASCYDFTIQTVPKLTSLVLNRHLNEFQLNFEHFTQETGTCGTCKTVFCVNKTSYIYNLDPVNERNPFTYLTDRNCVSCKTNFIVCCKLHTSARYLIVKVNDSPSYHDVIAISDNSFYKIDCVLLKRPHDIICYNRFDDLNWYKVEKTITGIEDDKIPILLEVKNMIFLIYKIYLH
jgi:hypothetical protein